MQKTQGRKVWSRIFGAILVVMALMFALVGCSSGGNSSSSNSSSSASSEQQTSDKNADADKKADVINVTMTVTDLEGNEIYNQVVQVEPGSNIFQVLENSGAQYVSEDGEYGAYVTAIEGLEAGTNTGWTYTQNGESVMVAADQQEVLDGDTIQWQLIEF